MSNSSRKELEKLYMAQIELKRRYQEAPLLFYREKLKDHKKQPKFHEAGKKYRRRLFLGANRCGKTTAGTNEALAHAYGYRYWEIPNLQLRDGDLPPREDVPSSHWVRRVDGIPVRVPNVGMVCSGLPRERGIGENIFPAIESTLPFSVRKRWKVIRGSGGVAEHATLPNGSKILFATEQQDTMTFEGFVVDWVWIDEPVRKAIYSAIWRGLTDYCGSIWFTLTPLGVKSAWLYNSMYIEPRPEDVFVVEVVQSDNPFMTEEKRKAFKESGEFTEREEAARLYGRFEFLGDRVFDIFNPEVHIVPSFMPPAEWIHGLSVDPHHRRPDFLAWFAFDPTTQAYHFYREWPTVDFFKLRSGKVPPSELAGLIRNIEGRQPAQVRICDPRFGKAEHIRHGYKETSFVERMAQYGLTFDANVPNTGTLEFGHDVIVDLLRYDKNFPVGPTNHPRLVVHDCCQNIATAFMYYGYTDVEDPKKGLFKKVSEEYKDPIDAVRYAILYPIPATQKQIDGLQRWSADEFERENNDW